MVVVHSLDERLDLGPLCNTLLAHTVCNFQRVLFNSRNNCVTIRPRAGSLIKVLDNDGFFTGKATREDQHDLTTLEELDHYMQCLEFEKLGVKEVVEVKGSLKEDTAV